MPENHRQAGGAQPHGSEHRHLADPGEGGQHHNQVGGDGRQQRQQQRIANFGQALPGRMLRAVYHPFGQVVKRVVCRNSDDAHAHHQRHQVQLAKEQQRHHRPRQRADGNGEHAQQQRAQRAEHRHDEQEHAKQGGDTQRRNITFGLLAGVIAVEHGPAGKQLCLRVAGFQRLLQRVKRRHKPVGLLHIK